VADHRGTYLALVVAANGGLCADAHSYKNQQQHSNGLHWHRVDREGLCFVLQNLLRDAKLPFAAQSTMTSRGQELHPSSTLCDCDEDDRKLTVQL